MDPNPNQKPESAAKPPLLNKQMKTFMAAMVLANIPGNMHGILLPLYLVSLNANIVQIGLFFTLAQIIPLALQILGGYMSDTLGRLRSIAIASVMCVFSYVFMILAPTWQWVLVGVILDAIASALVGPSYGAFVAEQSDESNRAKVYGITDMIYSVVGIIGPPFGGWLAGEYGFKLMLTVAAVIYTTATVIRIKMVRDYVKTPETPQTPAEKLSWKGLKTSLSGMLSLVMAGGIFTWIMLTDGVRDSAFTMSFTLVPVYLEENIHLTVLQIGWLESIFHVAVMATTVSAGWLADKKGERLVIALGFLLECFGMVLVIFGQNFWGFAAAWVMFGIGTGMMSPAFRSLISKVVPEKLLGTAMGVLDTSLGIFSLPAPWIGSQLWTRFNPRLPYILTAVISALAIIPVWLKFKLPKNSVEAELCTEK